jgi:hypothetical protein
VTTRVESRAQQSAPAANAQAAPPLRKGKAFENQSFGLILKGRPAAAPALSQAGRPLVPRLPVPPGHELPVAGSERPPPLAVEVPRHDHERQQKSEPLAPTLDPLARSLAGMRPWTPPVPSPAAPPVAPNATLVQMEQMITRLVRRVAWGGDGARGTARIELGAGELAGATITVHSDARELSVDVDLPPGVAAGPWRERLLARLQQRGFAVRELNVS